jgi:hypothetical protein
MRITSTFKRALLVGVILHDATVESWTTWFSTHASNAERRSQDEPRPPRFTSANRKWARPESVVVSPKAALSSHSGLQSSSCVSQTFSLVKLGMSSDWSSFAPLDDDDGRDEWRIDRTEYAREEDTQETKAVVGSALDPPIVLRPADPIRVPAGKRCKCKKDQGVVTPSF